MMSFTGLRSPPPPGIVISSGVADIFAPKLVKACSKASVSGDLKGLISSDGTYLYVCFADYTTGTDDIWARMITGGTW